MRASVVHSVDVDSSDAVAELIAGAPAAGFYGYGEIARLAKELHLALPQ